MGAPVSDPRALTVDALLEHGSPFGTSASQPAVTVEPKTTQGLGLFAPEDLVRDSPVEDVADRYRLTVHEEGAVLHVVGSPGVEAGRERPGQSWLSGPHMAQGTPVPIASPNARCMAPTATT